MSFECTFRISWILYVLVLVCVTDLYKHWLTSVHTFLNKIIFVIFILQKKNFRSFQSPVNTHRYHVNASQISHFRMGLVELKSSSNTYRLHFK